MGVLGPLTKMVVSGAMTPGEQYAFGFALINTTVTSQADLQNIANGIAGTIVLASGLGHVMNQKANGVTIDAVHGYYYATPSNRATYAAQANVTGMSFSAGIPHPNQCSVVVTLLTGAAGKSRRGRMYLPLNACSVSNGKIGSADVALISTDITAWIHAINGGAGGYQVAVASKTTAQIWPVTQIQIGDVYDTQRRRRNKIVEARTTTTI